MCCNKGGIRWDIKDKMLSAQSNMLKNLLDKEGAEKYSLGLTKFQALAKEAKAVYKIDGIALVNCEIFEKFLESFREC